MKPVFWKKHNMLNNNINHMKYECVNLEKGCQGTSELASYQQYTRTTKNVLTLVDYNQKTVTNQFIGIVASLEHLNIMRFCVIALLKL